jgi:hypothetical protein
MREYGKSGTSMRLEKSLSEVLDGAVEMIKGEKLD